MPPPPLSEILTVENSYIFRITHRDNLGHLLRHGIHCRSSSQVDPRYVEIGNPDIIGRRHSRSVPVPQGGMLSDYVPFYFTPCTPMLYNIVSGYQGMRQRQRAEIAIIVSSLPRLDENEVSYVVADRNASLMHAKISSDRALVTAMPWDQWRARDFRRDPNDPSRMEKYQAEALVHRHLPVAAIMAIITYDRTVQDLVTQEVSNAAVQVSVSVRSDWYP